MKRTISLILVLCLLLSSANLVFARASDYIASYNITVSPMGNGVVRVQATLKATTPFMTTVGFPSIILYEWSGTAWVPKQSFSGKYNPNAQCGNYTYTFDYQGVAGRKYYAFASYYVADSNGSDRRELTSATIVAT